MQGAVLMAVPLGLRSSECKERLLEDSSRQLVESVPHPNMWSRWHSKPMPDIGAVVSAQTRNRNSCFTFFISV